VVLAGTGWAALISSEMKSEQMCSSNGRRFHLSHVNYLSPEGFSTFIRQNSWLEIQ